MFSLYYALPEERENDCNAFDLSVQMKKEHDGRSHHDSSSVHTIPLTSLGPVRCFKSKNPEKENVTVSLFPQKYSAAQLF